MRQMDTERNESTVLSDVMKLKQRVEHQPLHGWVRPVLSDASETDD